MNRNHRERVRDLELFWRLLRDLRDLRRLARWRAGADDRLAELGIIRRPAQATL